MKEVKENKHLGVYGLVIEDNKILLIKKVTGPYDGKLDLPGGSFEFGERPAGALKRELMEETGLEIIDYELYDVDSVNVGWMYGDDSVITHHIGIFYRIFKYLGDVKNEIEIDSNNDDSLGAEFYEIDKLCKDELSLIAILELEKLGYKLN